MRVCAYCQRPGTSLLLVKWVRRPGRLREWLLHPVQAGWFSNGESCVREAELVARYLRAFEVEYAHAYCLVEAVGLSALAVLPSSEIEKVTVSDLLALALDFATVEKMLRAARRREGQIK